MSYFDELADLLKQVDTGLVKKMTIHLNYVWVAGRQVFVMGNGGSASTASHFVCDLLKNTGKGEPGIKAIGLADNMALVTAYSNDEGYENAFMGQMTTHANLGDILIVISTSGNSPNVLEVVKSDWIMDNIWTVALTGFDGGQLGKLADLHINVPSDDIEKVEDCHLAICHAVTRALREGQ